jgi:chromosomal replication initiator protein
VQEVVMEDLQVAAFSAQLAERIGRRRFDLWFKTEAQLSIEASCLTIRAASQFVIEWLRKHLGEDIRRCWDAIIGQSGSVVFDVGAICAKEVPAESKAVGQNERAKKRVEHIENLASQEVTRSAASEQAAAPPWPELATFIVGASNEYAFRAAELTSRGRQQASPLLFCGPSGVGKSHLLRGIVRDYRKYNPRASAVYLSAEQFTTAFVEALRGSGMPSFRQKCRGARLLAIDDLQFFPGKRRTIEELLHTMDAMAAEGRQLVLASDRSLSELRALGPELLSRVSGGLICEMEQPEYATRLGILRRLRDAAGLSIDEPVLSLVATQITAGARELQGALYRLDAMSKAYGEPITRELAERALADLARHNTRAIKLGDVQKAVCDMFGIEAAQLRSERKGRSLVEPRMLAMWLARKYTRAPWSEIGDFFGRRSHSTVISAHRKVEKLITSRAQIGVADQACNVEDAIRRLESALRTA